MAHEADAPDDGATQAPAPTAWSLGVLVRTGELGARLPLSVMFRAWCTAGTSTRHLKARIAELEATIAQHGDERARTAERLAVLDQDCAAALHEAKVARQVAAEVREAHARLDNDARAFRDRLAEAQDRASITEAELASSTEAGRRETRVADEARVERDTPWREQRTELEAACRQARERSAELEKALARQQGGIAAREHREAMLRAELDAARIRAQDDPERTLAKAELERVRASLAETETTLQATRSELAHATDQMTALSKSHDQLMTDRSRLAAELGIAEQRPADLERRLEEFTDTPPPSSRPIPF